MNSRTNRQMRQAEQGAVLVVVMLVLLGLMGLGMTALWMTSGNLQVGANVNLRANALYVAEAGIEQARAILNGPAQPNLSALLAGQGHAKDSIPTLVDAQGIPNGIGAVMMDVADPIITPPVKPLSDIDYPPVSFDRATTAMVNAQQAGSQLMGRYTVWIRNDGAELRQGRFLIDQNKAVVVRSQGMAMDNRTSVVLEVMLGKNPAAANMPGIGGPPPPVLCNAGKNACDDNSSTQYGIVAQ
jgi:hypothetical protein